MSNILASHINLYTSPVFYHFNLETPQRPFQIYTLNSHLHSEFSVSQNTSVHSEISCPTQSATRPPTPVRPAETSVAPRQSEGFLGTRDCLRHHIDPRATMTTRLLMTFTQVYDVNL